MSNPVLKDTKDLVHTQLILAFDAIPIPHTIRSGSGWFFAYYNVTGHIGKFIKYIFSLDGVVMVDLTNIPLEQTIYQALAIKQRSSDQACVASLQIELSGDGDQLLYGIIERTIKTLPENYGKIGRYLKNDTERKKFISRIIDEFFNQKIGVILSAAECMLLVQEAKQKYISLQDQARFLSLAYEKKRIPIKP